MSRSHATRISGRLEHLLIVLAELGDLHANLLVLLLLFVVLHRLVVDLILKLLDDSVATLTRFGSILSYLGSGWSILILRLNLNLDVALTVYGLDGWLQVQLLLVIIWLGVV